MKKSGLFDIISCFVIASMIVCCFPVMEAKAVLGTTYYYQVWNPTTKAMEVKSTADATVLVSDVNESPSAWAYIMVATSGAGTYNISGRVTCTQDTILILGDGCTLTANDGINVAPGKSLTICAGNTSSTIAGTGALSIGMDSEDNMGTYARRAGIGGDESANGSITINGGVITVTGAFGAAGIGGGFNGAGNNITINGGTVTATGGRSGGAGIGGGSCQNQTTCSNITINGGTVTATGTAGAAGIGGGSFGIADNITINGGTVTATGTGEANGIGSGKNILSVSGIELNGGTVEAFGAGGRAAIGGGNNGAGATVPRSYGYYVKTGSDAVGATLVVPADRATKSWGAYFKMELHAGHNPTVDKDSDGFTAECTAGCGLNIHLKISVTTSAAVSTFTPNIGEDAAQLSAWTDAGLATPTISYLSGSTPLSAAPTTSGTYIMRATVGSVSYDCPFSLDVPSGGGGGGGSYYYYEDTYTPEPVVEEPKTTTFGMTDGKKTDGKEVEIPDSITRNGKEMKVTEIADDAFFNVRTLEKVLIPDTIEIIGYEAFRDCTNLKDVELGENVVEMKKSAFYGCSSIETIEMNDKLEEIGDYAFKKCTGLKEVTIGSGVTTLGRSVFSGCKKLESVEISENVETIGKNIFKGCTELKELVIKSEKLTDKTLAKNAFAKVPEDLVIYVPKEKKSEYVKLFRKKGLSDKVKIKSIK